MFICSPFVSRLFLLFRTVEDACPYNHFGIVCLFFFLFSLLIGIAYIEPRHYGGVFVLQKKDEELELHSKGQVFKNTVYLERGVPYFAFVSTNAVLVREIAKS